MSRQQHYDDDDDEVRHTPGATAGTAGQHEPYDQDYESRRDYDSRQSGYYQEYEDGRYSQQGGYYEGSDVGNDSAYYNQQRGTYGSEDSRADYYRQDVYADDYPDAYPAGVDPYGIFSFY
jgi:hypothetical protein